VSYWYILRAEMTKYKGTFKRYYLDTIGEIVSYTILIVGLFYTIFQEMNWTNQSLFQLLIGIFIWYIAIQAISNFGHLLQDEMEIGTLEQIFLTRTSLVKMLFGRAIGTFLFSSLGGIVLIFVCFILISLFSDISFSSWKMNLSWFSLLIILMITMLGVYGFAFLLAGLSLVFKRIGVITVVFHYLFLFFTGITLADKKLPWILDSFSQFLPITWGVVNLKQIILSSQSLVQIVTHPDFFYLCLNTLAYLTLGLLLFRFLSKRARKTGNLGQY
jgi:ABC-2 type transport system permease protein